MLKVLFTLCVCVSMNLLADDPAAALKRLMEGNNRYVHDKLLHPDRTYERRQELKSSQNPFAVVVGCSDSRVSPEIVFDQGIGDLFVVRLAGNVVGPLCKKASTLQRISVPLSCLCLAMKTAEQSMPSCYTRLKISLILLSTSSRLLLPPNPYVADRP